MLVVRGKGAREAICCSLLLLCKVAFAVTGAGGRLIAGVGAGAADILLSLFVSFGLLA